MIYPETTFTLKDGRVCVVRSAKPEDAEALVRYLKVTAAETPFLLREPEEAETMTVEHEEAFLCAAEQDPFSLMLVAFIDGEHAGNCSFSGHNKIKTRHRCDLAIALYQEFCGLGLGRKMIEIILDVAKKEGYEQMELEVIDGNDRAKHLYESLGFVPYGVRPNAMKYKDGTYRDETLMVKTL